ncbi:hypothetical protein [Micromonospora echinofusca]|uniref:Uncharacterized protein n=1 Tax=Micromonospora echinofusca TaxID=47858 RepID=A0A1C5G6V4_MICEH|nr:hypothetical protein [Micromonospora echinofusca]SCG15437.1 hypothetical protein GA0070610_1668 [Micromonospora echinofusca]
MSSADGADAGPAESERVVLAAGELAEAEGWALLHGTVMLTRGGRLRPDKQEQREDMIMSGLLAGPEAPVPARDEPTPRKPG